jgi:hypothetical protein
MPITLNGTTGITSPGGDTSTSLTTASLVVSGTSNTSALTVGNVALGAGNATRFKNRIINGDMRIDQRNAGASYSLTPTDALYTLDRWQAVFSQVTKYTVQQNAGSVTPPTGFINYLGCTSTSAYSVLAGDYFFVNQLIEGLNIADLAWGTANAKTVTVSFQVYSSLTGTFGGALTNGAQNRSYPFTYTISSANTWTQISVTIAGDTSGTWLTTNGAGIRVRFGLGVGTTYSSTAGVWAAGNYMSATGATSVVGTNGATFYITGVQLEIGSSASSFEYVDYTTQLVMCQRYYEVLTNTPSGNALASGYYNATTYTTTYSFRVTKRTAPTVALGATGVWNGTTPSVISASVDTWYIASTNSTAFYLSATAGQPAATFSSEL